MKQSKRTRLSLATTAIHGNHLGAFKGPVATPIYQTSTYRFQNSRDAIRFAHGDPSVYVYTRYHNPTVNEVEERIALMERGEAAALFASGMAAISTTILSLCRAGDEIVSTPALYGGSYRFFRDTLPGYSIAVKHLDPRSLDDLLYLISPKTKVVYFETPTNPTLSLVGPFIDDAGENPVAVGHHPAGTDHQREFQAVEPRRPGSSVIDPKHQHSRAIVIGRRALRIGVDARAEIVAIAALHVFAAQRPILFGHDETPPPGAPLHPSQGISQG